MSSSNGGGTLSHKKPEKSITIGGDYMPDELNSKYSVTAIIRTNQKGMPNHTAFSFFANTPREIRKALTFMADDYERLETRSKMLLDKQNIERNRKNDKQ